VAASADTSKAREIRSLSPAASGEVLATGGCSLRLRKYAPTAGRMKLSGISRQPEA